MKEKRNSEIEYHQHSFIDFKTAIHDKLSLSLKSFFLLYSLDWFCQNIFVSLAEDQISKAELWLTDIADSLGSDWIRLAHQMKIEDLDVSKIEEEYADDSEKALVVLHLWIQKYGDRATGNELEKALRSIGHEDIVQKCMYNIEEVTDAVEKVVAKVYLDSSKFLF